MTQSEFNDDEENMMITTTMETKSPLPIKAHHIRFNEEGIATIMNATCKQMIVDAFAIELQRLNKKDSHMNASQAYNESVSFFLHQSNHNNDDMTTYSTTPTTASKNRRNSFLQDFAELNDENETIE